MKKLLFIILLFINVDAFAFGDCVGQLPPLCLYPLEPICIHVGIGGTDYYVCAEN